MTGYGEGRAVVLVYVQSLLGLAFLWSLASPDLGKVYPPPISLHPVSPSFISPPPPVLYSSSRPPPPPAASRYQRSLLNPPASRKFQQCKGQPNQTPGYSRIKRFWSPRPNKVSLAGYYSNGRPATYSCTFAIILRLSPTHRPWYPTGTVSQQQQYSDTSPDSNAPSKSAPPGCPLRQPGRLVARRSMATKVTSFEQQGQETHEQAQRGRFSPSSRPHGRFLRRFGLP